MLKIDLRKAYDTIEWEFIEGMLRALEFPEEITKKIMTCVRSTSYSIALNGGCHGFFKGRRGIRQGDPLSPLLFTICMEYLTRVLQVTTEMRGFKYHSLCQALKLNHLCFADDLLMFCKGEIGSIMTILRAFSTFSHASGLAMNRTKSHIYFNGMSQEGINEILQISGFQRGTLPFTYLGVTISHMNMRVKDCSILTEKIVQRIRGWGARKLSYMGRLTLVKHVLSQIHSYWTRIMIIPTGVIKQIDAICRNYLWEGSEHHSKAPMVSWNECCKPRKEGGLGLKSSKIWNQAMIAKYTWWLANKADHLWVRWVNHIYIREQTWQEYKPNMNSSWSWRKICSIKNLVLPGYVGNEWQKIGGAYTVGAGYQWLTGPSLKVDWHSLAWNRSAIPKHQFIAWLAMRGRLMTLDRVQRWNWEVDMKCYLCQDHDETGEHLFFSCPYSIKCLQELRKGMGIHIPLQNTFRWCISVRVKSLRKKKFTQAAITGLIYSIWRARNQAYKENCIIRPTVMIKQLLHDIRQRVGSNTGLIEPL